MNAPFSLRPNDLQNVEQFERLKLQLLEAFYELDVALEDWIHDGKGKAAAASTGCRLKELVEINFLVSVATKAQTSRFQKLSTELDSAIKIRNLIVHSEASFGTEADQPTIFLRPVDHDLRQRGFFAHKTREEIVFAIEKARSVARSLSGWRTQRDTKLATADSTASTNEERKGQD